MKQLRILLCSILLLKIFSCNVSEAQGFSARFGIYDFTDNTASEFYVLAPTLLLGYDVWRRSLLDLQLSSGFSYRSVSYNSHSHYLYMVPFMVTVFYDLPNPGAKVYPSFGMGTNLLWKSDHNQDFDKTHYSLAYGFHATGRLNVFLKNGRNLTFDMTYNLVIPPASEEINLSGVLLTFGMSFPSKHPEE